jgi:pilus assembly protein CpaE
VERVRAERLRERSAEGGQGQVIVVAGTKGGVGTTFISTNLAVALARRFPGRVLLADLARPFPHVGQFLDLKATHTIMDLMHSADKLDPIFVEKTVQQHKSKLDVLLSSPEYDLEASRFTDIRALNNILTLLRSSYRWVVIDLGFWLDTLYNTLVQEADQVLLVTELTVPALHNLKKLKNLYHSWGLEEAKVNVVVNRFEKDYTLGLRDLENIFRRPALATLPSEYASLIEAINQGVPLEEVAPRSKLWRRVEDLAAKIVELGQLKTGIQEKKGLLARLFS